MKIIIFKATAKILETSIILEAAIIIKKGAKLGNKRQGGINGTEYNTWLNLKIKSSAGCANGHIGKYI